MGGRRPRIIVVSGAVAHLLAPLSAVRRVAPVVVASPVAEQQPNLPKERGNLDHVVMADPEGNEFCTV
jgi:hypothetical protein